MSRYLDCSMRSIKYKKELFMLWIESKGSHFTDSKFVLQSPELLRLSSSSLNIINRILFALREKSSSCAISIGFLFSHITFIMPVWGRVYIRIINSLLQQVTGSDFRTQTSCFSCCCVDVSELDLGALSHVRCGILSWEQATQCVGVTETHLSYT